MGVSPKGAMASALRSEALSERRECALSVALAVIACGVRSLVQVARLEVQGVAVLCLVVVVAR